MPGGVDYLKFMGAYKDGLTVFKAVRTPEEIRFLIEIAPPRGPVVSGIDEIFSHPVQCDVAAGSFLDNSISADVIAMGVRVDDERNIGQPDTKSGDPPFGLMEAGRIARVDEHRRFGPVHKVISVKISSFDKKKIA